VASSTYERLSAQDSSFVMFDDGRGQLSIAAIAVFDEPAIAEGGDGFDIELHRAYVEVVREVAAEKSAALCDLARVFDALPRDELLRYMKDDGIHFTPDGGEKVGDLLFDCLLENGLLLETTTPADTGGEKP